MEEQLSSGWVIASPLLGSLAAFLVHVLVWKLFCRRTREDPMEPEGPAL